jgi:hypothetical protein
LRADVDELVNPSHVKKSSKLAIIFTKLDILITRDIIPGITPQKLVKD